MIPSLSIVVPVYNSAETIEQVFFEFRRAAEKLTENYECIYVDDGSSDGSYSVLRKLHKKYPCTTVVRLTDNRGQQNALLCGLSYVTKEYIVTADDDLRHYPGDISVLYHELRRCRCEAVYGIYPRQYRQRFSAVCFPAVVRKAGSTAVDRFFTLFCGKPADVKAGSFRIMNRRTAYRIAAEHPPDQPFVYLTAALLTFTSSIKTVTLQKRPNPADSRYSLPRLFRLFAGLFIYYSAVPAFATLRKKGGPFSVRAVLPPRPPAGKGKKILFLGSGNNQLNPIRRGKEFGYYIIASDYFISSEGKTAADAAIIADAFDPDATLGAAGWLRPDAVLSTGTDQTVLTMAALTQRLGLPGYISPETAKNATDKSSMKQIFRRYAIPAVPSVLLTEDVVQEGPKAVEAALRDLKPPYVTKPPDSQGQRGVLKLGSAAEAAAAFYRVLSYSRQSRILVEEYYKSDEITVSGWVKEGHVSILSATDRVTFERGRHIGICKAHMYPSKHLPAAAGEIESLTRKIAAAFTIREGPIYFQFLLGADGLKVNEIACRLGGAYEEIFLPLCTGFDILRANFSAAVGEQYSVAINPGYNWRRPPDFLSAQLFFARPGTVRKLAGMDAALRRPSVIDGAFHLSRGAEIGQTENASARAGYFIVRAGSPEKLRSEIDTVFSLLKIEGRSGENLIIPYSDSETR